MRTNTNAKLRKEAILNIADVLKKYKDNGGAECDDINKLLSPHK